MERQRAGDPARGDHANLFCVHELRRVRRPCAALFRSFNQAGVTVLVSTHDASLFAASRPRRLVLAKGLLVEDSRPGGRPAHEEAAA